MKKTLKNITAYIVLAMVILSSGSYQVHFMHCSKTNLTRVSPIVFINSDKNTNEIDNSECNKCRQEISCKAHKSCHKTQNTSNESSNTITYKDACCVNYLVLYKNDFTGESSHKINITEIQLPALFIRDGFHILKPQAKFKFEKKNYAEISPPRIIQQIIKSIRQKSIQSPDDAIC